MKCSACQHENREGAKFCEECGASIQGSASGAQRLESDAATHDLSAARKVVTIVFADVTGSTALQERLDPESARGFMERYYRVMRTAVEAHGGTVVKLLGDGVMAAFGVPRVAEDDAIRAVRSGIEMLQAFRDLAGEHAGWGSEIGLRVGMNTGEVVVSSDDSDIVGDPVNVAARLQQEAGNGEVVIGESTQRLVGSLLTLTPLGSYALKGRSEAVKAYRVVSLERPSAATATAFVGRDEELARLTRVYDRVKAAPSARLAVIVGSPGLGKSRLIHELGRRLGPAATVILAQCDAAGGGTFAPLAVAFRQYLGVDATAGVEALRAAVEAALPSHYADRGYIARGVAALLTGAPTSPEETFFAVRRFLAGIAAAKPVVLVIDDLHSAEPLLLDLVEHLIQWGAGVPLLVLGAARPELRDTRASLTTLGGHVSEVVTLTGLDASAATRLAANVIGAADLPASVAGKLLATSEGNPLFVAELVRMLVQEGALKREGERWIVGTGLAELEMPLTIHALLAARLERLRPEERTVLEHAAVVGRSFSRNAIAALLPGNGQDLDTQLESLKRSELIEPDSGWFLGEPVLRFHHVLIRDAAYRRLLKGTRAELHARFADWVEARAGNAIELDETVGRHLEQAHQHLRELGPLDARGHSLGARASQRLAAAGRRALAGDDLRLAAGLLGRAIERLDTDDEARATLALDWCEALLAAGDVATASKAIDELARFAGVGSQVPGAGEESMRTPASVLHSDSDPDTRDPTPDTHSTARLRAWHTCFTGQLTVLTAPQALQTTADAVAAAATEFVTLGDAAGEAKAYQVHAQALARLGKVGACEAALDRALAAARKAGDRRRANAVLAGAPVAALWGPSPVTRASGRCLDVVRVLRITQGAPAVEAVALGCQGLLEALRGRTDAARRMIASSHRMVEELGITHRLLEADAFAGRIELLEGNATAAERSLRGAYEGLRDLGLAIDAARAAALLARAFLAQGKAAEAEGLTRESEALAGDDLQAAIAWRGVRAEALAQRGEHAAAIELAQTAVTIAAATDALLDHADACLALAAALRAAGRSGEADVETRRASELWEAKGATLLAERVRREERALGRPAADTSAISTPPLRERAATPRRRVPPNKATAVVAAMDAAFVRRDIDKLAALLSPISVEFDHRTRATWGREEIVTSLRWFMRSTNAELRHQPLATLGDSLMLCRRVVSATASVGSRFDVAEYGSEAIAIHEVDEHGLMPRAEVFAEDRLGDAIARLYERHAELLPDARERERAAVTARAVTFILTDWIAPDQSLLFAPTYEDIDHRSVGYGTLSVDQATKLVETFRGLADAIQFRVDEVLALGPRGLVRESTASGVWRDGGGAFERSVCAFSIFGPDGRVTRQETFDSDRAAEALARFDELVSSAVGEGSGSGSEPSRLPRPETADAASRTEARQELLGTLDDQLRLFRRWQSASAVGGGRVDVGGHDTEELSVDEIDETGRQIRSETFAADHLGSAVVRLYQRYAELLPGGPARTRATATAGAIAAMVAPPDLERYAAALAPSVEFKDHRTVGFPSGRGAARLLRGFRSLLELASNVTTRVDKVVRLERDAILMRWIVCGTERRSGGAFESAFLLLWVFGREGLITHDETFDAERDNDASARFETLITQLGIEAAKAPFEELSPKREKET